MPAISPPDRPIRFFHRGAVVEVTGVAPTRSVLDWLREDARRTGTKEGCNEGDCGACTVVIGEIAALDDPTAVRGLALKTVNACIRFVPTLDGKALYTVEDLKEMASATGSAAAHPTGPSAGSPAPSRSAARPTPALPLHPVQQAMVDCHGSQCGFCTPGFVMSLWSTYERCNVAGARPSRQQLADELAGNLCRCTGYRPILEAGQRMFELPTVALDTAPALAALRQLSADADLAYVGPPTPIVATAVPVGIFPSASTAEPTAAVHPPPPRFHAPTTLDAFAALRLAHPDARILAGSTDIGIWVNKQFRPLGDILYLGEIDELKRIEATQRGRTSDGRADDRLDGERRSAGARASDDGPDDELVIGAGASLESAFAALAARAPELTDAWLRFASPPIRNAGTLGGNVANGSPIGDAPPILMALDAVVVLRRGSGVRRLPLDELYVDYMQNRIEPGEFVRALAVPLAAFARQVRGYKISKRFDSDISAVFGGFAIALDGEVVREIRLAYGGMAATARRATGAEAAILGRPWSQATVDAARAALADDFRPLSDMRASAGYRLQVAQNLIQRFWLETRTVDRLPAGATSVYATMPHRPLGAAA